MVTADTQQKSQTGPGPIAPSTAEQRSDPLLDGSWTDVERAWTEYLLGHYSKAKQVRCEDQLRALDQGLTEHPNDPRHLADKGVVLCMLRRYPDALQAVDQALALSPDDAAQDVARILGTKGRILRMMNRTEEAVEVLRRSVWLDPNVAWVYAELGETLRARTRYEEAQEVLRQGLRLAPHNVLIGGTLGILLGEIGDFEESAKLLREATQREQSVGRLWGYKGLALERLGPGWAEEAREAYEIAEKREPEDLRWRKGVANTLWLQGKFQFAKQKYQEVLDEAAKRKVDADSLSLSGWCHYRLCNYKDAVRCFSDALSLNGDSVSLQFEFALVLMRSGQHKLSLNEYRRGLEMAARKKDLRRRGLLYIALLDLRDALKESKEPNEIPAPENEEAALEAVQRLEEAFHQYKPSIEFLGVIAKMPTFILDRIAGSVSKPVTEISSDDLCRIRDIDLSSLGVSDQHLEYLAELKALEKLSLRRTNVTNAGLQHLAELTSLRELCLRETHITDDGVAHLSKLTGLRILDLGRTGITDAGMEYLAKLTSLQELGLRETRIGNNGVAYLSQLSNLKTLDLRDTKVDGYSLESLCKLQSLQTLLAARSRINSDQSNKFRKRFQDLYRRDVDVQL